MNNFDYKTYVFLIFICRCPLSAKTRKLLASYIGLVKGTLLKNPLSMPQSEYDDMMKKLKKECDPVYEWVNHMGSHCHQRCVPLNMDIGFSLIPLNILFNLYIIIMQLTLPQQFLLIE